MGSVTGFTFHLHLSRSALLHCGYFFYFEDTMSRFLTVMVILILKTATLGSSDKQAGLFECKPENVRLWSVSQELQLTWEDHSSCTSLKDQLVFDLLILIEDKQVHQEEFAVMPDQIGFRHWWKWKSFLPLECASHSISIRSRYRSQTSSWRTETLPGQKATKEIQVYPQDEVFEVGRRATFCCIVPLEETFKSLSLSNYPYTSSNTSLINNHTFALTVDFLWPTNITDADVICVTSNKEDGSCARVGYPPSDRDLKCETRDFQSVQCSWTTGPSEILIKPTQYRLLDQSCPGQSKGQCLQIVDVQDGKKNWTLIAENVLGSITLVDEADLTKRVYMYAPEDVAVPAVRARTVTVTWAWTVQRYYLLNLTCQVNVSDGETHSQIEESDLGLRLIVLKDLIPNWSYSARVRCATKMDFWKWSEWSKSIQFHTKGDFPDALDVWMHKANNQTLIMWKLLEDHQSHGDIMDYEVTWTTKTGQENKTNVVHPNHSIALNLSSVEKYIVTVTVRNTFGSSDPSLITIPSRSQGSTETITSRIVGQKGGFGLSWKAIASASCGYIIDWCPCVGDCDLEWLKLPPNNTSATIYSKNFKDGVRYKLSIYVCTEDTPMLLERREGYVKEQKIPDNAFKNMRGQQRGSDVEISWDPISLREQAAFINGYVLYCEHDNNVARFTTGDPDATRLTAKNLNITSYEFTVYALTSEGECGSTTITVTLSAQTDNLVSALIIPLLTAFTLLFLITLVCCRHWSCIKQKVYPSIPEPVLTGKWLPQKNVASYCPEDELTIAVPELHKVLSTSSSGYINRKDKKNTYTTSPTLPVPLKKNISLASTITSTRPKSITNPVYDLVVPEQFAQFNMETEFQNFNQEDLNDYQPQLIESFIFNFADTGSTMPCDSTYIVLPHSS